MNTLNLKPVTDSDPSVILTVGGLRKLLRDEIKAVLSEQKSQPQRPRSLDGNDSITIPYLTINEASEFARIAVSTVRSYIRKGKLKTQKVGRRIIISRAELEKFLGAAPA